MDIGLAAALISGIHDGETDRYRGLSMMSALPTAPVVEPARGIAGRRRRRRRSRDLG